MMSSRILAFTVGNRGLVLRLCRRATDPVFYEKPQIRFKYMFITEKLRFSNTFLQLSIANPRRVKKQYFSVGETVLKQ